MDDEEHAWHYTTAAGLISIVTNHRLWATSAAYMNDRDEIRAGREALQKAVDNHKPPLARWQLEQLRTIGVTKAGDPHDLFLLCAALDGDALTLWRSYGGEKEAEYSIDLDPGVTLFPVQQNDAAEHPEPAPPRWRTPPTDFDDDGSPIPEPDPDDPYSFGGDWGKVEYLRPTSGAAERELSKVLSQLKKPTDDERLFPFFLDYLGGPDPTTTFKHPGFADEQEIRVAWTVWPWWRFVLYRGGRFGVTPYIEVATAAPTDTASDRGPRFFVEPATIGHLPIRAIRIGPTRAADEAKKSLRALLNANGYGHVEILVSETPYR